MHKYKVFQFVDGRGFEFFVVRLASEGIKYPVVADHTVFSIEEMAKDYCSVLNFGANLNK